MRTKLIKDAANCLVRHHNLPTPFIFLDESEIVRALSYFRKFMPDVRLFYSAKTNSSVPVLKYLSDEKLSMAVASAEQIETCVSLGLSREDILLVSPYKTERTIQSIFEHQIANVAVDSIGEIERILDFRDERNYQFCPDFFIRIRVESRDVEINLNKKFGCAQDEALAIVSKLLEKKCKIAGISFHVGTQCKDPHNFVRGMEAAMWVAQQAAVRHKVQIPTINIGGGFCDLQYAEREHVDLDDYYSIIGEACSQAIQAGYSVYAEPGRVLVSLSGTLVTSVIGINYRNGTKWAYLDDGIYGCYSLRLYEHTHFEFHVIPAKDSDIKLSATEDVWVLAGPTCCSIDIISENAFLTQDLTIGDTVITPNLGAYASATANQFNGYLCPPTYLTRIEVLEEQTHVRVLNDIFPIDENYRNESPQSSKALQSKPYNQFVSEDVQDTSMVEKCST